MLLTSCFELGFFFFFYTDRDIFYFFRGGGWWQINIYKSKLMLESHKVLMTEQSFLVSHVTYQEI